MDLSLMSYNIHQCVGMDGRRDPGRVARVIAESGADVIGLQEVHSESNGPSEFHQMEYLAASTGLQAVPGSTLKEKNSHYGNVLLTDKKILAVHQLDMSFPGREPRGAIDVDLDVGGEAVRVIVTHLGLRPAERRFQTRQLLATLAEERTRILILMCDFNEPLPVGRPLRWLQARLGKTKALRTFPSFFPLLALDRIWVSPQSLIGDLSVYSTPLSRIASDHLPIKARVRISLDDVAS